MDLASLTSTFLAVPEVVGQAAPPSPTPEAGPAQLVDLWPIVVRSAWFFGGTFVVSLIGWFGVEPILSRAVRRRNPNNPTVVEAVSRYVRLIAVVVGVLVGASLAGYGPFSGNSALVIAAGTLALGVAGQAVIGSLVSGTVLVLDPEFNVGDYIEWDDTKGTVRSITLRVTRVQTVDGELVTVPNTELTSQAITRPFAHGRYRVRETVGVAYDADLAAAQSTVEAVASEVTGIASEPSPKAYVDEFGSDAVVLEVLYWIDEPGKRDVADVQSRYARQVKARLESAGIELSPASRRDLDGQIDVRASE